MFTMLKGFISIPYKSIISCLLHITKRFLSIPYKSIIPCFLYIKGFISITYKSTTIGESNIGKIIMVLSNCYILFNIAIAILFISVLPLCSYRSLTSLFNF